LLLLLYNDRRENDNSVIWTAAVVTLTVVRKCPYDLEHCAPCCARI